MISTNVSIVVTRCFRVASLTISWAFCHSMNEIEIYILYGIVLLYVHRYIMYVRYILQWEWKYSNLSNWNHPRIILGVHRYYQSWSENNRYMLYCVWWQYIPMLQSANQQVMYQKCSTSWYTVIFKLREEFPNIWLCTWIHTYKVLC